MDTEVKKEIISAVESAEKEIIEFAQDLIRIPSLTGEESQVAEATVAKMKKRAQERYHRTFGRRLSMILTP